MNKVGWLIILVFFLSSAIFFGRNITLGVKGGIFLCGKIRHNKFCDFIRLWDKNLGKLICMCIYTFL